jgi:hypothetical protein
MPQQHLVLDGARLAAAPSAQDSELGFAAHQHGTWEISRKMHEISKFGFRVSRFGFPGEVLGSGFAGLVGYSP